MSSLDTHLSPPDADRTGPGERTSSSSSSSSTSVDPETSDPGLGAARRPAPEPDSTPAGWRTRPETAGTTRPTAGRVELRRRDSEERRQRSVPDRVRRRRRRNSRLRRTAVVALTVLLAGTVVARWHEDPATILASGATVGALTAKGPAALDQGEPADDVVQGGTADGGLPGPSITTTVGSGATASASANAPAAPAASVTAAPAAPSSAAVTAGPTGAATAPSSATASIGISTPVPASTSVLQSGTGTFTPVEIPDGPVKSTGRTVTYGVDVEDGLPQSSDEFAEVVRAVLTDSRGWQTQDDIRFVPVSVADRAAGDHVDIRVTLASPAATQRLCAPLDVTTGQVSCWNGSRAVLNLTRWVTGADTYGSDLTSYREYLISHEVGHGLGYQHTRCPGPGQRAPIMVQQTKSLEGCAAWPWPHQT